MIVILNSTPDALYPYGVVVNDEMEMIGTADSYPYRGGAFAVHTGLFAGHVSFAACDFYRKDRAGYYPVQSPCSTSRAA